MKLEEVVIGSIAVTYLSTGTEINLSPCPSCFERFILKDESKRCGECQSKVNRRALKLAA